MRNYTLIIILLAAAINSSAKVNLGFPGEKSAYVGIYIKNLTTGEVIAENESEKALTPASIMKALTAASAITTLPSDFKFITNIYLTDTIIDGVCKGDLIVESCGDPTIDSENFENRQGICQEIADALQARGIKSIEGKLKVNQSLSQPGCIPEWEIDDVAWGYGAGLYGLNYKDNKFRLWPATGRTSPHVPNLDVTVKKSSSEDLVRGIFSNNLIAYGPNPESTKWVVTTTMNSPADVFIYQLNSELANRDIVVGNLDCPNSDIRTMVLQHQSPTLDDILSEMLIHSHNLYAEAMLRALLPKGSRSAAIKKQAEIWTHRGVPINYMRICDGSGLARADRLRPTFMAQMLEWMAKSDYGKRYASLLPKVGKEGTVKNFLKGTKLQGKLALKTGSMNAVQCYAGYMLDEESQPTHVVVIMINAFYCDRATLRSSIEKFLLKTL